MPKSSAESRRRIWESGWFWVPVAFSVYWWIWLQKIDFHPHEADVFYHHALSRILPWHGVIPSLPQVDDLEWGAVFPEKEYLFHFVTRNLWALGGDPTFMLTAPLFMLATLGVLLGPGMRGVGVLGRVLGTTLAVFWSPFVWRTLMLRPHQGAILSFSALLVAVLNRAPRWALVAGFLAPWLYHAIHFPLALLFAAWVILPRELCASERAAVKRGALGVLLGSLIHPYFPGNLLIGWEVARISLVTGGFVPGASELNEPIPFGAELFPRVSNQYIRDVFPALVVFGLFWLATPLHRTALRAQLLDGASQFLPRSWRTRSETAALGPEVTEGKDWVLFWLLAVAAVLALVMGFGPRAIEYLGPVVILLGARVTTLRQRPGELAVGLCFVFALVGKGAWDHYKNVGQASATFEASDPVARVLQRIPKTEHGAKVFNCEWDASPMIFDARPDLKFVDILDPSLLLTQAPRLYKARMELVRGEHADPFPLLRGAFAADYVLCRGGAPLVAILTRDPRFEQLSPKQDEAQATGPWLFALRSEFRKSAPLADGFLRDFDVSPLTSSEIARRAMLSPKDLGGRTWYPIVGVRAGSEARAVQSAQISFQDLKTQLPASVSKSMAWGTERAQKERDCFWFRPRTASAVPMNLLVGGGPDLRLWGEGQPLFTSQGELLQNRLVQYILEGRISATQVVGLVCSHPQVSYAAWTLGTQTAENLERGCPRDDKAVSRGATGAIGWRTARDLQVNLRGRCFAPVIPAGTRP